MPAGTDPTVLPPGDGEQLTVRGSTLVFKAAAATTGGAFSLHERHVPAGGRRPPAHAHPDRVEAFWVLEGEAEFELDGEVIRAAAGSFVLVPGGAAHTFGAAPGSAARLLVLHAPALDGYFRELAQLWSAGPPAREAELDLMRRHGMRPV
ncbi:MAG: cupin domain-containing protein [Streptosporangiaceae bacterium]|nr:cupin domain-containing protein [Streptosporangiaceae bacterium]